MMMKKSLWIVLLVLPFFLRAQLNVELLAQIDYEADCNDIWGWAAPDGTEYALVGLSNGISLVNIDAAAGAGEVAFVPGDYSLWRDLKTYGNYAYVVADQSSSRDGLHVLDLSALVSEGKVTENHWYPVTPAGDTLFRAHNIYIDERGIAYIAGSNLNGGGIIMLDLADNPTQPPLVGAGPREYAHDVYASNGRMYASELSRGQLAIYDVENIQNVRLLATQSTPFRFTHNAWASADGRYVFTTDERSNAPVAAFDLSDLSNIRELDQFRPPATLGRGVIPHNVHVLDRWLVISYYTDGVIIVDASRPENLVEVGQYDTYPVDQTGFRGAWGAYPFLPSGRLLVSDIGNGLFILKPSYVQAAYLEGKVTDAVSGLAIRDADIQIQAEQVNASFTDGLGNYQTGLGDGGSFQVRYHHPEYKPQTITVNLRQGEVTVQDVALERLSTHALSGQAQYGNAGVAGAQVLVRNENFEYTTTADENGRFRLDDIYAGRYEVIAGAWGFMHRRLAGIELQNDASLTVTLDPGYQDDFLFDLGWQALSNASSGDWMLGLPDGVVYRNRYSTPPVDVPGDLGQTAYLTDNGGGSGLSHDVDNGTVTLLSPPMDLTGFEAPILSYYRWFFNWEQTGSGPPDDALTVHITNGQDTVLLETIEATTGQWLPSPAFELRNLITITDRMQLIFRTSDQPGSPHVVEAAIDAFLVTDGSLTPAPAAVASPAEIKAFPNPFTEQLNVQYQLPSGAGPAMLSLFNTNGQELLRRPLDQDTGMVELSTDLPAGLYWIRIAGPGMAPATIKVIKQK